MRSIQIKDEFYQNETELTMNKFMNLLAVDQQHYRASVWSSAKVGRPCYN